MKKLTWLSLILVSIMMIGAVASAAPTQDTPWLGANPAWFQNYTEKNAAYQAGFEAARAARVALTKANEGHMQAFGDQGGVFTASLNATYSEAYGQRGWVGAYYGIPQGTGTAPVKYTVAR